MVEHVRNVADALRALHDTQGQVVILGAIEILTQASQLRQQRAPDHHQMADVVAAAQIVRAEIGLAVGIGTDAAILSDLVLIGVEHIRRFADDGGSHMPQRIRAQ